MLSKDMQNEIKHHNDSNASSVEKKQSDEVYSSNPVGQAALDENNRNYKNRS